MIHICAQVEHHCRGSSFTVAMTADHTSEIELAETLGRVASERAVAMRGLVIEADESVIEGG